MKFRWTAYLLIISIVTACFSFSSSAFADTQTAFSITADSTTVNADGTVTFTVSGQHIRELYAYEVKFIYDDSKLQYASLESKLDGNSAVKQSGNQVLYGFSKQGDAEPSRGDVDLFTITFNAQSAGRADVTIQSVEVLDKGFASTVYPAGVTASVTVTDSQSPTPPPSTPPSTTPPSTTTPKSATVNVNAQLDGNKIARADVQADDLSAALANAQNNKVTIKVDGTSSAKGVDVSLPASVLNAAGQAKIEVDTGLAVIELAPKKLEGISSTSGKVELSVGEVDSSTLTDEAKSRIGDNPVYDFNLSVDGVKIESFKNQAVAVKLKYTLKPGEDPDHVVIYYIDDQGKLSVVENGKYDSATGQVIFKPKHFSQYAAAYRDVDFNDIARLTWAADSIRALASRDIVTGSGDGHFNPGDQVTRAEFIVMLMRSLGLIESDAASTFSDVSAGRWYADAIGSAQQLGIVKGYSDGTFGINEKISRQEMATMLYKAAQLAEVSLPDNGSSASFADRAAIASFALDAVDALTQAGLVNGVGGGRFAPAEPTTRAEAAVILWRLLEQQ